MHGDVTVQRPGTGAMAPDAGRDPQPTASERPFALFASMWAIASVVHLANQYAARIDNPAGWLNLAAAVAVLHDPRSVRRLVVLAVAQVCEVLWVAPRAPDHAMLAAAVNVAVVLCFVRARRSRDPDRLGPGAFLDDVARPARVILLIAYTAAAVAKYNANFFDPTHSCAAYLADVATFGLVGRVPTLLLLHIAASVVVESLIPLLLVIPATRRTGVRVGIVFHFLVSLSPTMQVGDFTTTLWPLFLLFLADDELTAIADRITGSLTRSPVVRAVRAVDARVRGLVLAAVAGAVGWLPFVSSAAARIAVALAVAVYGVVLIAAVLRPSPGPRRRVRIGYRPPVAQVVLLLLCVVWALNPYVGFRTTASFTMFSGLVTEGPGTNHFFMPSVHVVGYQNDLVEVLDADDERYRALADTGQAVPYFEVQRAAAEQVTLTGRRDGRPLSIVDGVGPVTPPNPILAKLWLFRAVPADDGVPQCTN
jgi:hypothetical protein